MPRGEDSNPGTPCDGVHVHSLPDTKTLELILDKLQKKDIYGVYAEPFDPEELPDYHDVIKRPMDFSTVRKKLANGSYETLEQFEDDVFLICSNAMEYNAPDTIYYKQARSIKELATRKFEKLRLKAEGAVKPEQKQCSTVLKKPINSSIVRTKEPFGSTFSSSPMSVGVDLHSASQNLECERPGNADTVVGKCSFTENLFDKGDESLPGKGMMSRLGKKMSIHDENRRETYETSLACNVDCSLSMFSSSDGEAKQLIPVGLYSDHSYARSLARFAATLGSVVWEISSKRIEQALSQGFQFGCGWVGDYEPLPTPALIIENCNIKEPSFFTKAKPAAEPKHEDNLVPVSLQENHDCESSLPFFSHTGDASCSASCFPGRIPSTRVNVSDMSSFFLSSGIKAVGVSANTNHISQFKTSDTDQKVSQQFRQGVPPMFHANAAESIVSRQNPRSTEMESPKVMEFASRHGTFSMAEKSNPPDNGTVLRALPNRKVPGRMEIESILSSSVSRAEAAGYYQQALRQALNVQAMRMLAEKAPNQWSANSSSNSPMIPASPTGAVGFRSRLENQDTPMNQMSKSSALHMQLPPQYPGEFGRAVQLDRNSCLLHTFVPQGSIVNGAHFHKQRINYPQLATDLSRFQLQPTWRSINPPMLSRQKQESVPPDLNIGFQSLSSPGGPSSSVLVDPQQPDLVLQL